VTHWETVTILEQELKVLFSGLDRPIQKAKDKRSKFENTQVEFLGWGNIFKDLATDNKQTGAVRTQMQAFKLGVAMERVGSFVLQICK